MAVKDAETLPLYNFNQKETVKDVVINPELSAAQQSEIRELPYLTLLCHVTG